MLDPKKLVESPSDATPSQLENPEAKPGFVPQRALRASREAHRQPYPSHSADPFGEDRGAPDAPDGVYDDSVKPG